MPLGLGKGSRGGETAQELRAAAALRREDLSAVLITHLASGSQPSTEGELVPPSLQGH